MAEMLIAALAGVLLGTFTGIVPGVHVNLVAAITLSLSAFLLTLFSPIAVAAGIVAMSITHVFVEFIPSVFLGAPSDSTAMAILPGHQMLLKGRGYEAVMLSSAGAVAGVASVAAMLPILLPIVKLIFNVASQHIGLLLLSVLAYNVIRATRLVSKLWTLVVISMAGILGTLALAIPNLNEPLLPLLSGLFGISTIAMSLLKHGNTPIQTKQTEGALSRKMVAAGIASGGLVSIFPALGPAQAAMLVKSILRNSTARGYLTAIGAVNATSMLFALITLFAIGKARNGSIAMMSEVIEVEGREFAILTMVAVAAAAMAFCITHLLAALFSSNIHRISYGRISAAVIALIAALATYFSGLTGLIILLTGTLIGVTAIAKNVERHNLMACLMIPVILHYF